MAEAVKRTDPTGWIARQMLGAGTGAQLMVRVEKKALVFSLGSGNGSCINWANPENVPILAAIVVDVTTAGTGTAGIDIGVGTSAGSSDNLLDAGRVDTVAVVSPFGTGGGSNGKPWRRLTAAGGTLSNITGKANDVDATAVANAYIIYIPAS